MYKKVPTYEATIYIGLRRGYDGDVMPFKTVEAFIQDWVDNLGMCVTVTRTQYFYTNYPRFPAKPSVIEMRTLELAQKLLLFCKQMNLSIVYPDRTIMISNQEEIERYEAAKKEVLPAIQE